ncbi:U-box protein [Rhizoctonia solani]|uniref:U-box protein n=1 Tax=Rhizoctonia solani TaxID=456999 RepID=A0A8H7IIE0_9AGAM|nr:U-box protein [Rhizoctonia solani]
MVSTSPDPSDSPPAYALTDQPGNFEVSLVAQPSTQELLVSLVPPAKPQLNEKKTDRRAPVDLCLVIDVSGSMNTEAPVPGEQDKNETTGLSVLDVVKHATRTIIESMGDDDRIAVVTFSDSAERGKRASPKSSTRPVSPPHPPPVPAMFATQRGPLRHAIGLVDRPQPFPLPTQELRAPPEPNIKTPNLEIQDSTSTQLDSDEQRLSAVFILTDGQPNVEPPRGHIPMIKSYLDALSPDAPKFTISTFGFGYNLDSRLLDEIAHLGQGMYGFIPDSGMVGTVFVHALANLMVTWATGCVLDIEVVTKDPKAETQVVVMGALPVTYSSWGASIKVGDIQYGQSKDFVIKLPSACFGSGPRQGVTITAKHLPHTHSDKVSLNLIAALEPNHEVESSIVLQHHVFRLSFIDAVSKILEESKRPNVTDLLQRQFEQSIASYLNDPVLKNYEPSKALAMDITSQVILGLEPKNWARWGVHYIPSIARSHQRQQCLNFKDEGLQVYGRDSDIFISTRDHIDQIFDSLPPPTPSLRGQAVYRPGSQIPAMYTPVGSMASYRSKKLPCFAGWCYIDTESGKIRLSELGRGTIVRTPSGTARVAAVLRTLCSGQMTELCTIGQLAITPWHPIYHNGSWVFPTQIQQAKLLACNYVYSVLLEPSSDSESHAVFIEGIRCVTLGHGCIDSLRAHPFLGDYARVVESLSQLDGYYDKSGVVDCAGVVRQYRVAIRVHKRQTDQNRLLDTDPISAAVTMALGYSTSVILAVSLPPPDLENLVSVLPRDTVLVDGEVTNTAKVYILPFTKATYGRFIPALNAIVAFAHDKGFEGVLFQSVEVKIDPENAKKMVGLRWFLSSVFDGADLSLEHFGRVDLNKLARTGFLLTSETNTPPNSSAIEEAPTIALHQKLFPGQSRALLVRFAAEDGWGTVWADPPESNGTLVRWLPRIPLLQRISQMLGCPGRSQSLSTSKSTEPQFECMDCSRGVMNT